jgi:hypothetical protein
MMNSTMQPLVMWLLIIVTISLVAGITYVYSHKNIRVTLIFTLFSIAVIGIIKVLGTLSVILSSQFIGRLDQLGVPYVYSKPGWFQIIAGWSIWLLPVLFTCVCFTILFYYYFHYKKEDIYLPNIKYQTPKQHSSVTITERLHADSLRTSMAESMEKLSDALLTIASQEISINDLKTELENKDAECNQAKEGIEDELNILQLEMSAKNNEVEQLTNELEQRTVELSEAHEMFEKLLKEKVTKRKKKTE